MEIKRIDVLILAVAVFLFTLLVLAIIDKWRAMKEEGKEQQTSELTHRLIFSKYYFAVYDLVKKNNGFYPWVIYRCSTIPGSHLFNVETEENAIDLMERLDEEVESVMLHSGQENNHRRKGPFVPSSLKGRGGCVTEAYTVTTSYSPAEYPASNSKAGNLLGAIEMATMGTHIQPVSQGAMRILNERNRQIVSEKWSSDPTTPIRDLEKAGALIAAEIDRMLRLELKEKAAEQVKASE